MTEKAIKILSALPLFIAAAMSAIFASCADDLLYDDGFIGSGTAELSATVEFQPLVTADVNTSRAGTGSAPGNAIKDITNLTVFIFNDQEEIIDIVPQSELSDLVVRQKDDAQGGTNTDMPNDAVKPGQSQGEKTTSRATFTLKEVPFGRYYMYAIANMGLIEDNETNRERFSNVKKLQNYTVEWNETDIPANAQMFGYFTINGNDSNTSNGFSAPLLPVNQKRTEIHSWIKRAASKVTIVYDGSGLHNGIWVYIKSVTIKDIPRYCKIGAENWVKTEKGAADSLIVNGGSILYNSKGILPEGEAQGNMTTDWLEISKGSGKKGAVSKADDGTVTEHSEYDEALYFYENMQGNYKDAVNKTYYNKEPDWHYVGWTPKPGEYDYKDNVPYGTYIEVDAYYVSTNEQQVSHGDIKYRFMLGQDDTYDYNAIRNQHYKLTLGFKGWANQPDWHIEYIQKDPEMFIDPTYYVSYRYNTRSEFPVRFVGDVDEFTVEIVENNWAPYDPKGNTTAAGTAIASCDSVPPALITSKNQFEKDFQWNRTVYEGTSLVNVDNATKTRGYYYYGLQKPKNWNGTKDTTYIDSKTGQQNPLAPEKVTPIWAGFLSLHADENLKAFLLEGKSYSNETYLKEFKDDYYNNHRNRRTFTKKDLTFPGWEKGKVMTKWVDSDHTEVGANATNNACEIVKAADGSITVKVPMWTQPKTMLGISGFSGNNPYDTYQRKATVSLMAKQKKKDGSTVTVTKYMPVKQVRRVVNPKGVWRAWNDNSDFTVKLVRREGAADATFNTFNSEGGWRAYVKTTSGANFISLVGGSSGGGTSITGSTGTPIEFTIKFNGSGQENGSLCAIVEVEYHGFTCKHSIFVRQGYRQPLTIYGNTKWSSFSLFSCDQGTADNTMWNATTKNYISAKITANPLALGTLFKRGNYNGILIKNNSKYKAGEPPGRNNTFELTHGSPLCWGAIYGLAFSKTYGWASTNNKLFWCVGSTNNLDMNDIHNNFHWGRFIVTIDEKTTRKYRVPTYDDYDALLKGDYGVGVVYGDGASSTAMTVAEAYGYEDVNNNNNGGKGSSYGMRGIIVYNPSNAHQLFFPIGARGMGRRTLMGFNSDSYDSFGKLRYGAVEHVLSQTVNVDSKGVSPNQYRPIPYNMPAAPGAIYWLDGMTQKWVDSYMAYYLGWDMNYFDQNFNAYDYAISRSFTNNADGATTFSKYPQSGDALPIKLVLDESN